MNEMVENIPQYTNRLTKSILVLFTCLEQWEEKLVSPFHENYGHNKAQRTIESDTCWEIWYTHTKV